MAEMEGIPMLLSSTMGIDQWELTLPLDAPVQALIAKFVRTPALGFRERDDAGALVPYRLMWKEAGRYLSESETLRTAGVPAGNMLIMTYEARAGIATASDHRRTARSRPSPRFRESRRAWG